MVEQQSFLPGMLYEADIEYSLAPGTDTGAGRATEMTELELPPEISYQEPSEVAFATSPGAAAALSARSQMQHQQMRAKRTKTSTGEPTNNINIAKLKSIIRIMIREQRGRSQQVLA